MTDYGRQHKTHETHETNQISELIMIKYYYFYKYMHTFKYDSAAYDTNIAKNIGTFIT